MIIFFIAAFVLSAIIAAGEAFYERSFPRHTFPFFALFLVLLVIAADVFH